MNPGQDHCPCADNCDSCRHERPNGGVTTTTLILPPRLLLFHAYIELIQLPVAKCNALKSFISADGVVLGLKEPKS